MNFKRISVIGLGYIGLPTAAMFASKKLEVIGVDLNLSVVQTINEGHVHIVEPGLDHLVSKSVTDGYLRATTNVETAEAFLIAVPTPFKDEHKPDIAFIEAAARMIAPVLTKGNLVVLESTSPVGTTEQLVRWLAEERPDLTFPIQGEGKSDVSVSYCPERVLPGRIIHELVKNDRIVGGISDNCSRRSVELYQMFVEGECFITDARTAELTKLVENASRDVGIAFANEISIICDQLNIDPWKLIELSNRHPRVNILKPGPGVGGHCIAVDPWFIVDAAPNASRLIQTARLVNNEKPNWVVEKVIDQVSAFLLKHPKRSASSLKIGCLGLTFKADIDDLRESPAVEIVKKLACRVPCELWSVEPNIKILPNSLQNDTKLMGLYPCLSQSDIILVLVDHSEFKSVDTELIRGKCVVDTRGIFRTIR